nr:MAG TPA: hypothetical protein [Caudoviricetes sp.]
MQICNAISLNEKTRKGNYLAFLGAVMLSGFI